MAGDVSLSGRFFQAAKEENFSYGINLLGSIIFFIAAVGSVMFETWYPNHSIGRFFADPLYLWLGKISLVAVCVIPATIFASQGTKHRRASVWYKTMGVRIASLKPYLSEVSGNYEAELKEIIKSFFISELKIDSGKDRNFVPSVKSLSEVVNDVERLKKILTG